jgi:hypothetical protein
LTYIYKQEAEFHLSGPRAYTYIGISKLSCRGCEIFIRAFNKVHHTKFVSKGQHHKAYYPWQFPPVFPESAEVAKEMYEALCKRFGNQYLGFRPKLSPFDDDSEAQTISDRQKPDPLPDEARRRERLAEMISARPGLIAD